MIAPAVIHCIQRLLDEKRHSQRKIARTLGVSRGTVASVAKRLRPDYEEIRRKRAERLEPIPRGPVERCGECGGLVRTPCRLCQLRRAMGNSPPKPRVAREVGSLALELRGSASQRYETVHRKRMEKGEWTEEEECLSAKLERPEVEEEDSFDEDWP